METRAATFVIVREDLAVDPLTLVTDGLKIGRLPDCELLLNHPTVSRLHAGIKEEGGDFYLYNFSHSSGTTLNGRVVESEAAEVLAGGDVLHVGPFVVHVEMMEDALRLRVTLQVAAPVGEGDETAASETGRGRDRKKAAAHAQVSAEVSSALSVFWSSRKREAGKMQRLSPLRPRKAARVLGKARFNWTPTRDLVPAWPTSLFVWGAIVVGLLTALAAVGYTHAFSPAPLSDPHARATLITRPAIAAGPNAGSCTTCHTVRAKMNDSCASCHTTEAFAPVFLEAHAAAGLGCIDCHAEHRGEEFSPSLGALRSCTECHTDANKKTYNGRRVGTPHGGTFGYPVADGRWVWEGVGGEEWEGKPAEVKRAVERWPAKDEGARRSAQFHALHLHRVRAAGGLAGNEAGEVSCSTCHAAFFPSVDRDTPRTTCAACHDGDLDKRFAPGTFAAGAPNCTSCHVQHPKGRRLWGHALLASQ